MLPHANTLSVELAALNAANSNVTAEDAATVEQTKATLSKLESIIQKGENAFFASSKAIVEIVDKQLFQPAYQDKTTYFRERWDMTPQNLSRFENAGRVIVILEDEGYLGKRLPRNEGQCRELYKQSCGPEGLDDCNVVNIWDAVINCGEPITAKLISQIAHELLSKLTPATGDDNRVTADELPRAFDAPETAVSSCPSKSGYARLRMKLGATIGGASVVAIGGFPLNRVEDSEYEVMLEGGSMKELLRKLAEWDNVDDAESLTISLS